jgi:CRISPR-associated protein Cas2
MKQAPDKRWYLIAYDVSDDRRRAKVAKCLEGHGTRLQYSVFRVFHSGRQLARLRWELETRMSESDGLLIIPLCPTCQGKVQDRHGARDWTNEIPVGFRVVGCNTGTRP